MNDFFRLDHDPASGIAELVLNRPERMNTMAPAFFPALRDAVQALDDAGDTRVLIVRGEGKHFCAGMALDTFAPAGSMQAMRRFATSRENSGGGSVRDTMTKLTSSGISCNPCASAASSVADIGASWKLSSTTTQPRGS